MRKRITLTAIALMILIVLPMTWSSLLPSANILSMILVGMGGLAWLILSMRQETGLQLPKTVLPALAFFGLEAVLLTVTPVPVYGIFWVASGLVIVLVFAIMVDLIREQKEARTWEFALLSTGLIVVLLDVIQFLIWRLSWIQISGSLFSRPPINERAFGLLLGHPNLLGGYINLFIPIAVVRLIQARKKARLAWGLYLGFMLFSLYLSSSRSAWIGCLASLMVIFFLVYRTPITNFIRHRRIKPNIRISKPQLALAAGTALVIMVAIGVLVMRQVQSSAHGTTSQRLDIYFFSIEKIRQSPIWGYGPGSTAFILASRGEAIGGDLVTHSHNLLLQTALVSGLIGVGLLVWGAILFFLDLLAAWRHNAPEPDRRMSMIAYTGILPALLVQNVFDFTVNPGLVVINACCIMALFYQFVPGDRFFTLQRKNALPVFSTLVLVYLVGMVYVARGDSQYWQGYLSAREGNWKQAQETICQAARQNPQKTYFGFQCSLAKSYYAQQTRNDLVAFSGYLNSALNTQEEYLANDPHWYIHWANLASYESALGNSEEAAIHLSRAAEMAPNIDLMPLNQAWMAEQSGETDEALDRYQKHACGNPFSLETVFFRQGTPLRRHISLDACQASSASNIAYNNLWQGYQAIKSGDPAAAEAILLREVRANPFNANAYAFLALAQQELGKEREAWVNAQTAPFVNDESTWGLIFSAQVALEQDRQKSGMEWLWRAYQLMRYPNYTKHMALAMYRTQPLPGDISPFLVLSGPPSDSEVLFIQLADHLRSLGKDHEARDLIEWLASFHD